MRRTWIFGAFAALLLSGCGNSSTANADNPEAAKPKAIEASLKQGQTVELILVKRLDAGACKEGDYVPLLVAEDVRDESGNVAFPKGSIVDAEVSWSRSEGTLSGMVGQPARLEIRLKGLKLDSSHWVPLAADLDNPEKAYAFDRSNTGVPGQDSAKIDELLKDEASRQALEQIANAFSGEEVSLDSEEAKAAMERIARDLGLTETQQVASLGRSSWSGVSDSLKSLQKGTALSIATGEGALAIGAVMELANLAGNVAGRIGDKLKGRTIRAFPGTRLRVYIAEDSKVTVFPR